MSTLRQLALRPGTLPAPVALHAADLGETRGRIAVLRPGAEARLAALRESALVESVGAAGRLDGVSIDPARLCTILLGNPLLLDRGERELRGLRDALALVASRGTGLPLSEATFRRLHRLVRGGGKAKAEAGTDEGVTAALAETVSLAKRCLYDRWVMPELVAAAVELDLLCLSPFGPETGRMALLGLLLTLVHGGSDLGVHVSLPRLTEDSRERYRAVLDESARGFADGWSDPWPFLIYRLVVLKGAYRELLRGLSQPREARTKADLVRAAVEAAEGRVTLAGLMRACPGVSERTIQGVLRRLKAEGKLEAHGRGPGAPWSKTV